MKLKIPWNKSHLIKFQRNESTFKFYHFFNFESDYTKQKTRSNLISKIVFFWKQIFCRYI